MTEASAQSRLRRIIRGLSLGLAALLALYALSDHPMYGGRPGFGKTQAGILVLAAILAASTLLPVKWNRQVLLVYLSSLFTLLIAEVAGEVLLAARHRGAFEMHPKYVFRLRADCYQEFRHMDANGGHRVLSRINRDGFRGEELLAKGQAKRVVVYGDSFIHAAYTPLAETYAEQLEDALEAKLGSTVEVVNAGVSSYGPDQVSLKLEDDLPILEPALVIVAIFAGNDFGDLLRNKLFELDDRGELVDNPHTLSEENRIGFELSRRESIIKRALADLLPKSPPRQEVEGGSSDPRIAAMEFALENAAYEYESFVIEGNDEIVNPYTDYYDADSSLTPNSESAAYKRRLMEAVMRRIQRVAKAASVPVAFVFIPHPFDVCENYDWGFVDHDRFPDYARDNLTRSLSTIAMHIGAPSLDLFLTFRAHEDANQLYFHGGDDHWNSAGQRLAAQQTADFLLAEGLLK